MKTQYAAAILLAGFGFNVQAATLQGIHFSHKDWETACDNTGTCRVVGYHHEEDGNLVSVLFTRQAGSHTISGELTLADHATNHLNILIDNKIIGKISRNQYDNYTLSPTQSQAVIAATKARGAVQIRAGKTVYRLSNAGAAAVWLKADEFQRFGKLKPRPKPTIRKAKTLSGSLKTNQSEQNQIRQLLRGKLDSYTCHFLHENTEPIALYRLNSQNILAETICWRGAYNEGLLAVVLDNSRQTIRQVATLHSNGYENGEIHAGHKSRGLGDCWSGEKYVWDGRRFVQTSAYTTGMCRGFAGGAWHLPTFVSDVK